MMWRPAFLPALIRKLGLIKGVQKLDSRRFKVADIADH